MKWIKASDKIPELYPVNESHENHYKLDGHRVDGFFLHSQCFEYFNNTIAGFSQLELSEFGRIEWLDETVPTPQGDKTAEDAAISNITDEFKADYIEACSDNRKLRKMLAEVTGLSRIATVEEYASHVKGQAERKYTKEDLRTAFDGAEYFVDFDKWFDALSTPIK